MELTIALFMITVPMIVLISLIKYKKEVGI